MPIRMKTQQLRRAISFRLRYCGHYDTHQRVSVDVYRHVGAVVVSKCNGSDTHLFARASASGFAVDDARGAYQQQQKQEQQQHQQQ
jgi:hypothetical protein